MTCAKSSVERSARGGTQLVPPSDTPEGLLSALAGDLDIPVYAYIVTTIKTGPRPGYTLTQTGSGPNFDGGRITLCTCKHRDRATISRFGRWDNVWVAGLTSKQDTPSRSLAYLMCVERFFLSQLDLWIALGPHCRAAKSASLSPIGDLYEPTPRPGSDPYDPANYQPPMVGHVHASIGGRHPWHDDIRQWGPNHQPHRLLLGQVNKSYQWPRTEMILRPGAIMGCSAHHKIYNSLRDFINDLKVFP